MSNINIKTWSLSMDYMEIFEKTAYGVAGLLGLGFGIKSFFKSKKKTDNFIEIHTEIHELLTELRLEGRSMRATVLQLHNGEYFMDGISMMKFSITHESSHKGYISQVGKLKGTQCSLFVPLLNKIIQNKANIHCVDSMQADSHARHFFDDENISHFSCLPLKNKGINVGFVLVQWHKDFEPILIQEKNFMDIFQSIRNSIELQLSHQKN
jgi:hypothetical protein